MIVVNQIYHYNINIYSLEIKKKKKKINSTDCMQGIYILYINFDLNLTSYYGLFIISTHLS